MSDQRRPFVLAAGGTGGHLFPAIAAAGALIARGERAVLMTDARGAAYPSRPDGLETMVIKAGSPSGGFRTKLIGAGKLAVGAIQARAALRRLNPAVVAGFGGYAAAPVLAAARMMRTPYLLHDSNAVLGRANRLFADRAAVLATTFAETEGVDAGRATRVGAPVRADIAGVGDAAYAPPGPGVRLRLLVTGGSQGAQVFADVVPTAIAALSSDRRARIAIAQQTRPEDLDRVRADYGASPEVEAEIAPFFDDMPKRLSTAHLAIARAGASTCAELAAAGRPAILVPYGFAMDDHQAANAAQVEADGAAVAATAKPTPFLPDAPAFTPAWLSAQLAALLDDPAPLATRAAAAKSRATPDAADRLAQALIGVRVET